MRCYSTLWRRPWYIATAKTTTRFLAQHQSLRSEPRGACFFQIGLILGFRIIWTSLKCQQRTRRCHAKQLHEAIRLLSNMWKCSCTSARADCEQDVQTWIHDYSINSIAILTPGIWTLVISLTDVCRENYGTAAGDASGEHYRRDDKQFIWWRKHIAINRWKLEHADERHVGWRPMCGTSRRYNRLQLVRYTFN